MPAPTRPTARRRVAPARRKIYPACVRSRTRLDRITMILVQLHFPKHSFNRTHNAWALCPAYQPSALWNRRRPCAIMRSKRSHSAACFERRLQCAVRPRSLWEFKRISQACVHILVAERSGQGEKARLTRAMTGRYSFHAPFIAQGLGDAMDLRLFCENEMKSTKDAVHAIFNRARGGENLLNDGM